MQQIVIYWQSIVSQHVSGIFMPIIRMLPAMQATFSTQRTQLATRLQHHNSYNRTDNYRQWNAVGSPDDGHKDARNML